MTYNIRGTLNPITSTVLTRTEFATLPPLPSLPSLPLTDLR